MPTLHKSSLFSWVVSLLLCAMAIGNLCLSWRRVISKGQILAASKDYSYIGNDYPEDYPMEPLAQVLLTTEDSVHYPLSGPTAAAEWASNNPPGGGYVHLGEPKRYLCVSMFHQLHCLRYIRQGLVTADDPYAALPHMQHCLNYLRQMILCKPDLTLEDPGWRNRSWEPGQRGATHTCRDWGRVYGEMEKNWNQWIQWRNTSLAVDASSTRT